MTGEDGKSFSGSELKCGHYCGSWLACDNGLSATNVPTGPPLSQASQLPQLIGVRLKYYFCAPSSCCKFACVMFAPAGTLRVSHTLPPMVEPLPMVMRPRIVAPA